MVVDFDSAYVQNIPSEIKAQTHYVYMYDSPKEQLNEMLTSRNPINRESLQGCFDLLKDRGTCIHCRPGSPYGFILHNIIPSSYMCQEGLIFTELWRNSGGAFKPVEPYYQRLNEIYESIKERVAVEFKQFEASVEAIREFGFSEMVQRFLTWLGEYAASSQQFCFKQPDLIKAYRAKSGKAPQQIYHLINSLAKAGLLTIDKASYPFTVTINQERLREGAKTKQEGVAGD